MQSSSGNSTSGAKVKGIGIATLIGTGIGYGGYSLSLIKKQNLKQLDRIDTSRIHPKFTAIENYPDLSRHNNTMAKVLTPEVIFCYVGYY